MPPDPRRPSVGFGCLELHRTGFSYVTMCWPFNVVVLGRGYGAVRSDGAWSLCLKAPERIQVPLGITTSMGPPINVFPRIGSPDAIGWQIKGRPGVGSKLPGEKRQQAAALQGVVFSSRLSPELGCMRGTAPTFVQGLIGDVFSLRPRVAQVGPSSWRRCSPRCRHFDYSGVTASGFSLAR